ncbi:MAG: SgcJ/EcaC family oxidoreductase [Bryobacterales bacterium]|nr:SgcJ/EcaC family oxidoreductase [Bryobacterales bacterium]
MQVKRWGRKAPLLLCALLLAPGGSASSAEDEEAVKDLVGRYAAARESRDPDAIRQLFTEDADQLVSSGVWRRGRETLVEGMLGSSRRNPGSRTLAVETVRFPSAGLGIADARYIIRGSGGAPDRKMWSTFVFTRTDGGWRIAAIRNMLPAP